MQQSRENSTNIIIEKIFFFLISFIIEKMHSRDHMFQLKDKVMHATPA